MNAINKIGHFGTFDVDNYGDLLFPHIAEYRLPNFEWVHISPTDRKTIFKDGKNICSYRHAIKQKYDALITGGGNILHLLPDNKTVYKNFRGFEYANLWIGASKLASEQKIPHIYNGPGISKKINGFISRNIAAAGFKNANYIGLREKYSRELALDVLKGQKKTVVQIIPDTAFDIGEMWPIQETPKNKYISVNLNPRYHNPINKTASFLDKIALSLNMPIKFIIIGACHGDYEFTKIVSQQLKGKNQILDSDNLKEIAHTIGNSSYFFGSSMHGLITALSYNTPAFLILNNSPKHKFKGLLSLIEQDENAIHSSFEETFKKINSPVVLKGNVRNAIKQKLDNHWQIVEHYINKREGAGKSFFVLKYKELLRINQLYNKSISKFSKILK